MTDIKIKISYFYQIRNFTPDMIPLSTALGDPPWFHDFTYDKTYQFKDKRGIWNGIRAEVFNPRPITTSGGCRACQKKTKDCPLKTQYKQYLDTLDFDNLLQRFQNIKEQIQQYENTDIDYTLVLMVHEAPNNLCSEREALIPYFKEHGYNLLEFQKEN